MTSIQPRDGAIPVFLKGDYENRIGYGYDMADMVNFDLHYPESAIATIEAMTTESDEIFCFIVELKADGLA